jgi:hypothetical protein
MTPLGMQSSVSETFVYLRSDLYIGCFTLYVCVIVDGPSSLCASYTSSTSEFCWCVTSSTWTCSFDHDVVSVTGCCVASACALGSFDYVLSTSSPFIYCGVLSPK